MKQQKKPSNRHVPLPVDPRQQAREMSIEHLERTIARIRSGADECVIVMALGKDNTTRSAWTPDMPPLLVFGLIEACKMDIDKTLRERMRQDP